MSHPRVRQLGKVLANYDLCATVSLAAGMCTVPWLQANYYRLELFIHLAVGACRGTRKPGWQQMQTWLNYFVGVKEIAAMEDPGEDAFVLNVLTRRGDFRVLPGTWEAAGAGASLLIDAVEKLSFAGKRAWLAPVTALLRLSDAVVQRAGLQRWHAQASIPNKPITVSARTPLDEWSRRVRFSREELLELGIEEADLACFVQPASNFAALLQQSNQESDLHRFPLLRLDDSYVLALPTAVSYALRRHLVACAAQANELEALNAIVMERVFSRLQNAMLLGHRHLATNLDLPGEVRGIDGWCGSVVLRVGQRHFLHFVVISFGLEQIAASGYLEPNTLSAARQAQLEAHMNAVREYLERTHDVGSGHSLLLAGHLGEALMCDLPPARERWTFSVTNLHDLEMLFRDRVHAANRLVLLLNQEADLQKQGVQFPFKNGLLNFYAYWCENNFDLRAQECPHDMSAWLQIPLDSVARYRIERRRAVDEHCERLPMGGYTSVEHGNADSIFGTRKDLSSYVSTDLLYRGVLAFCLAHGSGLIWIVVEPSRAPGADDAVFELWEGLQLFVARALRMLSAPLELIAPVVGVLIDCSSVLPGGRPESQRCAETALHTHLPPGAWTARIRAEPGFMHNFEDPENTGERYLLAEVLRAIGMVTRGEWSVDGSQDGGGERSGDLQFREWALRVLGPDARVLHSLRPREKVEVLLANDQRAVYLEPVEHMASSERTAFTWCAATRAPVQHDVVTSTALLNQAVQVKANALCARLRMFGRTGLITELLHINETLLRNAQRWKATARAVRGLYGVDDGTRTAGEAEHKRAQLQIAVRALVEAAACECSDEGRSADPYAIDELVAEMVAIVNFGRDSDVLYYGLATTGIRQYPSGGYDLHADIIGELSAPFHRATFARGFASAADDYDNLIRPEPQPASHPEESAFANEVGSAWMAEYGMSFETFRQIFGELMDIGVKRETVVVHACAQDIVQARAGVGVTREDVDAFVRAFGLPRRAGWLPREGTEKPKDINPWRFERRLSLSLRPLVMFDDAAQTFCYGVGTCRESLRYILDSIANASFDKDVFQSREMRSWLGGRTHRLGSEFSERVAHMLREAGWSVRVEIKPTELGAPKKPDLGDIDVFAWQEDGRVLQIECKRLKLSRTVAEIALACRRFRGNADDLLARHLRRARWVHTNLSQIARFMKLDPASLVVRHPLVVSRPVPFGYLSGLPIAASDIVVVDTLLTYAQDTAAWHACRATARPQQSEAIPHIPSSPSAPGSPFPTSPGRHG